MLVYQRATTPPMSISQELMMPETALVLAYRERTPADRIYLEERSKEPTQEWDTFENMYDVHIHLIHIMYIDIKWYNIYIYRVYSYNYTYALYQPLMLSCSTYLRSPGSPGPQSRMWSCQRCRWVVSRAHEKKERSCTLRLQWIGFMVDISLIYL